MLDQENYWIEWLDAIIHYCSQVALVHKYFVANLIKFNEQSWSLTETPLSFWFCFRLLKHDTVTTCMSNQKFTVDMVPL